MPSWKRRRLVYFILSPETNRVKIGFTAQNPNRRLLALRQMNAGELVPLAVVPGGMDLERALHLRFHRHRHHFEWFDYREDLKAYVEANGHPWPTAPPHVAPGEDQEPDMDIAARKQRGQALCAVVLRHCMGCSVAETAQTMGLDPAEARRTVSRRTTEGRELVPEGAREVIQAILQGRKIPPKELFRLLHEPIVAACDPSEAADVLAMMGRLAESA